MTDDLRKLIDETKRLDRCAVKDWRQEGCKIKCGPNGSMLTKDAHGSPMFIAYDDASAAVYCRNAAPVLAAEVERLDARLAEVERERDEALLTLAAEQGRQEGAPSEGWQWTDGVWSKDYPSGHHARVRQGTGGGGAVLHVTHPNEPHRRSAWDNQRAAMLAADAAGAMT